jgi:hypothetical protein
MKYVANPVEVDALRIESIADKLDDGRLTLKLEGGLVRYALPEMLSRMEPKVGDYFVVQSDGYIYLNPKEVFERKYHVKETTNADAQ